MCGIISTIKYFGGNTMQMKILGAGALMMVGWLWVYLFVRQFLFNFLTAYPLIKKMQATQEDLIAIGASRYTTISVISCAIVCVIVIAIVVLACPWYFALCFFFGAIVALVMFWPQLGPTNRAMFDSFCDSYYRFVPDDELRTAMYNHKPSQMKVRLHDMGLSDDFIPEFKK
jgi:hypothetical protein